MLRYTLGVHKVDEKTCRVTAKVVNSIFGIVKHDGERWKFEGDIGTTKVGVGTTELHDFERRISRMLTSIDGIVRDGPCLMVNFGGRQALFIRSGLPSAATKDDIKWMR